MTMSSDEQDICGAATVAAVKPRSWASYALSPPVSAEGRQLFVVAEKLNPPEPGIGLAYEAKA